VAAFQNYTALSCFLHPNYTLSLLSAATIIITYEKTEYKSPSSGLHNTVAYLLKAITTEPEKQPLLVNGSFLGNGLVNMYKHVAVFSKDLKETVVGQNRIFL
jgi:hypothetical protein